MYTKVRIARYRNNIITPQKTNPRVPHRGLARCRNHGIKLENYGPKSTPHGSRYRNHGIIPQEKDIIEAYLFSQERGLLDEDLHAHDGVAVDDRRYLLLLVQRNRPVQDLIGARTHKHEREKTGTDKREKHI